MTSVCRCLQVWGSGRGGGWFGGLSFDRLEAAAGEDFAAEVPAGFDTLLLLETEVAELQAIPGGLEVPPTLWCTSEPRGARGASPRCASSSSPRWDQPRGCGEQEYGVPTRPIAAGTAPRARGCSLRLAVHVLALVLLPATPGSAAIYPGAGRAQGS